MLKNFITLAIRNLIKRKLFSFINIFGLALGVASCLVLLKYIDFETSYDNFHTNGENLYRVNRTVLQNGEERISTVVTSYGLGPALATDFPEVKRSIRTHPMYGGAVLIYQAAGGESLAFQEKNIQIVDSTFLRAFTYHAIEGNLETALDNPNSIVITRSIAQKYFGKDDPMGKTIKMAGGWCDGDYTVSAVIENVPQNTHFSFDILVPTHNLFSRDQYKKDDGWGWNNFITYVELNPNATREAVMNKLPDFSKRRLDSRHTDSNSKTIFNLQLVRDIHLNPGLRHDSGNISRGTVYFFGLIAVFILFIAWINYINLSTARAMERAHEVGIKKAIGAYRSQLVTQFFMESVLINFLGIAIAVGLAVALLPVLAGIINHNLSFDFSDMRLWLALVVLFILGSLVSGAYPALALSSFNITDVLKKHSDHRGFSLRKALVVFQFTASLILIAGTFVVYRQINYMRSEDKGLQMNQVLVVNGPSTIPWDIAKQKITLFKEELKKIPGVGNVATSAAIPGGGYNWGADVRRSGAMQTESKDGSIVWIDPDFIPAYNIQLIAGKNFDTHIRSSMESVIVNEASLKAYGLGTAEQALNEQIIMGSDTLAVLGVLKDYNWNSLKSEYVPFLFRADTVTPAYISIHLASGQKSATIDRIGRLYKELIPGDPFNYYFLDDFFNEQYKSDQQFGKIFSVFAILAVMISCLGLWGLASFTTTQRLKEIGMRKVLGATTGSIVYLLTRQFMRLVLVSALIAFPLVWYGMNSWLAGFAFRIGLQWDLFAVPLMILAFIALLTVSLQVLKGASTNPAKVLRSE